MSHMGEEMWDADDGASGDGSDDAASVASPAPRALPQRRPAASSRVNKRLKRDAGSDEDGADSYIDDKDDDDDVEVTRGNGGNGGDDDDDDDDDEQGGGDEEDVMQDQMELQAKPDAAAATLQGSSDFDKTVELLARLGSKPDGVDNELTDAQVDACVSVLVAHWTAKPTPEEGTRWQVAACRFGLCRDGVLLIDKFEAGTMSMADLEYVYKVEMFKRVRLEAQLRLRGMLEMAGSKQATVHDLGGVDYAQGISRLQSSIARAYRTLAADLAWQRELDPTVDAGCPTLTDVFGYVPYNDSKLTDYQSFIIYLLRQLQERGYRRYRGAVYQQIMSPPQPVVVDGQVVERCFATHAYERVCDIATFVLSTVQKEDNFAMWQNMVQFGNKDKVVDWLTVCKENEFLDLEPDRHWFSFHNGMYCTLYGTFLRWGDPHIPPDVIACKWHDYAFDESVLQLDHWLDVPTPKLHSIFELQFQKLRREDPQQYESVISWLYALLGRLLFKVGEKDQWQVIPFFLGRAGTGKSLLLRVVGWFFNDEDVETLANNSQKGFGLETFHDKLMWRCYEVKNDFSLDQAQLQSMISGEPVSIQRKNKTALTVTWEVPGILAGNEVAAWVDNSGSISRRMVLVQFLEKVDNDSVDPHLDSKIKAELPLLLHKCCSAYLSAVAAFGKQDIWSLQRQEVREVVDGQEVVRYVTLKDPVLPQYFHDQKKLMKAMTHPLAQFLKGEKTLQLAKEVSMPFDRFKALMNAYVANNGLGKFSWKPQNFRTVLEDFDLVLRPLDQHDVEEQQGHLLEYNSVSYPVGTMWLFGASEVNAGLLDRVIQLSKAPGDDDIGM